MNTQDHCNEITSSLHSSEIKMPIPFCTCLYINPMMMIIIITSAFEKRINTFNNHLLGVHLQDPPCHTVSFSSFSFSSFPKSHQGPKCLL